MIPIKRLAAFTLISGGIALGTLAVAQSATASPLNIVDNGDGTATGYWQLPATGTWPQSAINPGALCGVVQADVYPYATAADKARTDALTTDSTLTEGEDYGWAISWTIKEYPACATTPSTTPSPTSTPTHTSPPATDLPSPSPTVSVPVATDSPAPSASPSPTSSPSSTPSTIPTQPSATNPSAPPAVQPTVPATSPIPTVTSTSTSTPAAAASNRNGTGTTVEPTNGSTELAYTGSDSGPAIGGAVALLIGGLVMLAIGKKEKKA